MLQSSVESLVERSLAHSLALLSIDVSEGRKEASEILNFVEKFKTKEIVEKELFVTDNLDDIYESTSHTKGLRWRLNSLNKSVGSLRRGNFVVVFARVETGKTSFIASEVTHMAIQAEGPILWVNNEQEGKAVKSRVYQASLGCTLAKLYSDRPRAYEEFIKRTGGRIKLFDEATTSKNQIESLCKDLEPSLIIIDQIDKIKGFSDDRNDLRLGKIYVWAREISKQYAPLIGICQASGEAEGRKWLTMDHMADSKTSKPAEADVIIGIGKTNDLGMEQIRFLNIIKNKLPGDSDGDQSMRHAKLQVRFDETIARYIDL